MEKKSQKKNSPSRILIFGTLLLTITFNYGNYYISDIPQEMSKGFLNYFNKTPEDVEFLYSLYSMGATPMAVLGGFFVASFTATRVCLICSFGVFLSSIITFWGINSKDYLMILGGRLLYGLTAEPNQVAQMTLISEIFTGKFLSLATGLNQAVNNLGYASSYFFNPKMYIDSRGITLPFFVGGLACMLSSTTAAFWAFIEIFKGGVLKGKSNHGGGHKINLKLISDIKDIEVILGILNMILGAQTYITFNTFSTGCLTNRFKYSLLEAKNIIFLMPLLTIPCITIYSSIATKIGKKMIMLGIAYLMALSAYLIMIFHPKRKSNFIYLSFFLLSQFWSIRGSVVASSLALVTKTRALGLSFGLGFFGNNLTTIFVTMLFGTFIRTGSAQGYQNALIGMVVLASIGLCLCILTFFIDMKRGGILNVGEESERLKILRKEIDGVTDGEEEGSRVREEYESLRKEG